MEIWRRRVACSALAEWAKRCAPQSGLASTRDFDAATRRGRLWSGSIQKIRLVVSWCTIVANVKWI